MCRLCEDRENGFWYFKIFVVKVNNFKNCYCFKLWIVYIDRGKKNCLGVG